MRLTAIALLAMTIVAWSAPPNLLMNPGFESGLSPWTAQAGGTAGTTTSGAFAGTRCGSSTNRTATGQGLRQSVMSAAIPGRMHIASAWVRTSSPTPVTVNMVMAQTDARGARFSTVKSAQIADQWTRIEGYYLYDVNGTLSVLNLYFSGPPVGVDLFVDDVSFTTFDTVAPENLLTNADLEAGSSSWRPHGPGTVTLSSSPAAHTGTSALIVSGRTATWHGAEQSLVGKVEDGTLYYAAGWLTTDSPTAQTVRLTIEVIDSSGSRFFGIASGTASSDTWTWLSGHFKMPSTAGLTDVRLFIEGPPGGVTLRADNFYFAPLTGLRRAAVAFPGLRTGTGGLGVNQFALNEKVRTAVSAHFHLASPGNSMKFSNTEPADGIWTHAEANDTIALGLGRGGSSRGHVMLWHGGLPNWVSTGTFTAPQLQTLLWDQVDTKGAYYRHRTPWWDVANEAISDSGGTLRSTLWYNTPGIGYATNGDQFLRETFARARTADPTAALFYNDYSIEEDNTKSDAVHALLSGFVSAGIPLQGIGFQSHFQGSTNGSSVRANFQRFNDLGLDLHITELDFRIPVDANGIATSADLLSQGNQYFDYCGAALGYSKLKILQTWGIYDGSSWVPAAFPGFGQALLLDFNLDRKPAYWGMWNALAGQAEKLDVLATSPGDTTVIHSNTAIQLSANNARRLQASAANDFITLSLHVPFPGQWNVKVGVMKHPAGGTFQTSFAPPGSTTFVNASSPRDTYAASTSATVFDLGTVTFSTAGDWQFKATVTGKNATATDFDIALDYIRLTPVACSPLIRTVPNQNIAVNTLPPPRLVIAEDDTAQGTLLCTATSSNVALLPDASITLQGTSPYYTLTTHPIPDQLGTTTITLSADDGLTTTTETFTLTITGTPLQTWRFTHFGTTAETPQTTDLADSDHDTLPNLLEYAFATFPTASNPAPITLTPTPTALEFTYPRDSTKLAELTYTVEWSDTLLPESWTPTGVTETIQITQGTLQTMLATIPLPPAQTRRFVRVRVTRP